MKHRIKAELSATGRVSGLRIRERWLAMNEVGSSLPNKWARTSSDNVDSTAGFRLASDLLKKHHKSPLTPVTWPTNQIRSSPPCHDR